jgi:hypothetical protein
MTEQEKWQEAWRLIGELRRSLAETREMISKLEARRAPHRRRQLETAGKVVFLPSGKLADMQPNDGGQP